MEIYISNHARERMDKYKIQENVVKTTLEKPDRIDIGQFGRMVAQKALNGYTLRVIYEENNSLKTVITVYRAKSGRYEV